MRTTPLILGFGLLCVSLPATAETASSTKSTSARPEARVGSLAPDEARRAERARRRAAEKNAKAAARDTKAAARDTTVTEGKSVAVPGEAISESKVPPAAGAPAKAAVSPAAAPPKVGDASRQDAPPPAAVAKVREADPRGVEPVRAADKDDRIRDRRDRRHAARRKAHREHYAVGGVGDRRLSRQGMIAADDPRGAAPPGAPPYPMPPRLREAHMVRVAPPPRGFWGFGPRPFYSMRAPIYVHEPDEDFD